MTAERKLLAFSERESVLPDIGCITGLAVEACPGYTLLERTGRTAINKTESRYLLQLRSACSAIGIRFEVQIVVARSGSKRFALLAIHAEAVKTRAQIRCFARMQGWEVR